MPMDGLTLGFVARELNAILQGGRLDKIQQTEQDELLLSIRSQGENHKLLLSASASHGRIHLTTLSKQSPPEPPMFCSLARKHLTGARVRALEQIAGDRVLHILFDTMDEMNLPRELRLIMEIMGRHSNILLVDQGGRIIDAVRHVSQDMSRVREVLPGLAYEAPPSQGKRNPWTADLEGLRQLLSCGGRLDKALVAGLSGISPQAAQEWAFRLTGNPEAYLEDLNRDALAERLHALIGECPTFGPPVTLYDEDGAAMDAFPYPQRCRSMEHQKSMPSLSKALQACFEDRDRNERMKQRSQALRKTLKNHIERCEKKQAALLETLQAEGQMNGLRVCGELLTANLYRVPKGAASVILENYYEPDSPGLSIELDPARSPAQNAQQYFKRYQKLRTARELAVAQKAEADQELRFLETQQNDLDQCVDEPELEEVREQLIQAGYVRGTHSRKGVRRLPLSKPYRYRSQDGIELCVGKNSAQNDRLTAAADGEETWLHAKDMPGSHVIVRHKGPLPEGTLEEALLLAAWHSKAKLSQNVPVDYTLRKYVKKPGGAPLGFVIYTHQRTRYVTPDKARIKQITIMES